MTQRAPQYPSRILSALPVIRGGVSRGLTSKEINNLIRVQSGQGVRRVDLLAAIRDIRGIELAGVQVRNIRRDLSPDPARIPRARTRMLSNFSYTVEVRGTSLDDGSRKSSFLTVRSSTNMSRAEIEDAAMEAVDEAVAETPSDLNMDVDQVIIVEARRR